MCYQRRVLPAFPVCTHPRAEMISFFDTASSYIRNITWVIHESTADNFVHIFRIFCGRHLQKIKKYQENIKKISKKYQENIQKISRKYHKKTLRNAQKLEEILVKLQLPTPSPNRGAHFTAVSANVLLPRFVLRHFCLQKELPRILFRTSITS